MLINIEIWLRDNSRSLKLVPFESLSAVSSLPSVVTTAISVAVCEVFSVKEWCYLKTGLGFVPRSLEMTPFDRSHMRSYSRSIVSMALTW